MDRRSASLCFALAASALAGVAAGCGDSTPIFGEAPPLAQSKPATGELASPLDPPISKYAKLASIAMQTQIYDRPDRGARKLGYLRLGSKVHRSDKPVPGVGCAGEWYAVPRGGFVCVATSNEPPGKGQPQDEATLDFEHKLLRALSRPPDLSKPMPYDYAFVRANTALYMQVPTAKDQDRFEFGLRGHRRAYEKHKKTWNKAAHGGANGVPLDAKGIAQTPPEAPYPPPPPDTATEHDLFGGGASDSLPWFLHLSHVTGNKARFDREIPNVSPFVAPPYAVYGGRVARHAGLTLVSSFMAGEEAGNRRFALTLDGRLVPTDKLKPHFASAFHGVPIDGQGLKLPFAFVKKEGAHAYDAVDDHAVWPAHGDLVYRSVVQLTGKERKYPTQRYLEMADGRWVNVAEVAYVAPPDEPPAEFDWKKTKWIDVSIWQQTLVAYEGERPIYATLVSTGIDGMGDPKTTKSTVRGAFKIDAKHVTTTMDADDIENKFELRDVPWVQFFEQGYALHATYWHDDFGKPRSHGCVNLSPIDAHYLFFWTDPALPEGWHGVRSVGQLGAGTWVRVRG